MATRSHSKAKRTLIGVLIAVVVVIAAIAGISIYQNSRSSGETIVRLGLVGNNEENVWDAVQQQLDEEHANIKLDYKIFQAGIPVNQALASKEIDINAFQHYAFLNSEIKEKGYKFTVIGETYLSPLNLYSNKYNNLKDFKPGDKVAIPNDSTNLGRALKVLDSAGLIKLKDSTVANPTTDDIAANPSGIVIVPNDAAAIISLLPDYAAGITNTNYILDAGKNPEDALYAPPVKAGDKTFQPYINVIVANTDQKDNPTFKKIVDAYHTKSVAAQVKKDHNIPVFKY
jgi:D-methionine transport system substrate-binding protein